MKHKINLNNLIIRTTLILILLTTNACASMIWNWHFYRKYQEGFRFEKYYEYDSKVADKQLSEGFIHPQGAQAELLRLHPIGSNVDDLVKTLKKAGARCWRFPSYDKYSKVIKDEFFISCRYKMGFIGLGGYSIGIKHSLNNKIVQLGVSIDFGQPYLNAPDKEL